MSQQQSASDAAQAFAELGSIDLSTHDMQAVLARVAERTKQTIPGADEVSVSMLRDGKAATAAFTGELALQLDERQYEEGHGPCMEAAQSGSAVLVTNLETDDRWPDYVPSALEAGARSSLSVPLPIQEAVTGALNIYSREVRAFDEEACELAAAFAGYAAVAVANAQLLADAATLARQMQEAMASRAVIEQAKGVLMAQRGCDPDAAFDMLSRASRTSNRKLRDIAAAIVDGVQQG